MIEVKSKSSKNHNLIDKVVAFIGSNTFFWIIIFLFVLQAIWLAASAAFPMLYDEHFHISLIDLFSEQLSPFIREQSQEEITQFSDLTRNPSYFYHYLMSFPYRIISAITDSFYIQVLSLRLLNIGFVTIGLVLFRKLFSKVTKNQAVINVSLLILTLIPIFVFVASHVNYDNFLFLLTPLVLLLAIRIGSSDKKILISISLFLALGMLGALVKTAFLAIFVTSLIYVSFKIAGNKALIKQIKIDIRSNKYLVIGGVSLLLLMGFFFAERYLYNVVNYRAVQPSCQTIHSPDSCSSNRFIRRSLEAKERYEESDKRLDNIVLFTKDTWLPFIIEGASIVGTTSPLENLEERHITNGNIERRSGANPPSVLHTSMWVLFFLSILIISYSFREIKKTPYFNLLGITFVVLSLILLVYVNYKGYLSTGEAYAIQLRYLLVVLPIFIFYSTYAADLILKRNLIKLIALAIILFIFSQGGGIGTYIVSSEPHWFWQRETIIESNRVIKESLQKSTINSDGIYEGF